MMGELEVPLGIDVGALEETVDRVARHLFFGRYRQGRLALQGALVPYPCLRPLLDTIPAPETSA
jgi:hypothetical protein